MGGNLLRHIVEEVLAGNTPTSDSILVEFYGREVESKHDDPLVRVNVGKVRERLEDYYKELGKDDPVRIEIPKGGLEAVFSYNQRSLARRQIHLGRYHLNKESPHHMELAQTHFETAIQHDPKIADGYAGIAAALIGKTIHGYTSTPLDIFPLAETMARRAIGLDPNCWFGSLQIAAIHLFRHEWEQADKAIQQMEDSRPTELALDGGYGPYLLARGQYEKATDLAKFLYNDHPVDVICQQRAALYYYAMGEYDEARVIVQGILEMDIHLWIAHLLLAFIHLALDEADQALAHTHTLEQLQGAKIWPGLHIVCLAAAGHITEAQEKLSALEALSRKSYVQPMQFALGLMATGNHQAASAKLSEACDHHDPFTAWLHLWPFLDPLRYHAHFKALLRREGFPAKPKKP